MNTEHQSKTKLTWPVCQKSMKLKQKWYKEWLQLKMTFLLGYKFSLVGGGGWEIDFWWEENKKLVVGAWADLWLVGGGLPIPPSRENPVIDMHYKWTLPTGFYIQWSFVYIIYIMCPCGYFTSAWFEHFLCHRYIWYIYIFACLFSVRNTINLSRHV